MVNLTESANSGRKQRLLAAARKARLQAAVNSTGGGAPYTLKPEAEIRAEPAMSQGGSRTVDPNAVADFMRNPASAYDAGADIMANAEPMKADRGYTFASNMLNSLTLGNAANVAAVPRMLRTGQDFDESRGQIREEIAQGREDNPVTAFAGDAAGFVAPGGLVAKAGGKVLRPVMQAAQKAGPMLGFAAKTGAAATIGAADAALYGGTVQAENDAAARGEEATLDERLDTAGDMAKFGAAFGGVMPAAGVALRPVGRAAEGVVSSIAEKTGIAPGARQRFDTKVAEDAVRRSLERSGITTAEDFVARAAEYGNKPVVTGELGQDALNSLVSVVRMKGTTAEKAQAILEDRVAGLPGRMLQDIADETGLKPEEVFGQLEDMIKAGRERAAPLYEAAEAAPFAETPNLERITQAPVIQGNAKTARGRIGNQSVAQIGAEFEDPAAAGTLSGRTAMPPLKFYDELKQLLDEDITGRLAAGKGIDDIEAVRKQLVDELDLISAQAATGELTPDLSQSLYAKAREAGGDAPKIRAGAASGERAFGAAKADTIVREVSQITGGQLDAYRIGAVRWLTSAVEKGGLSPRRVRSPDFARKIKAIFGDAPGQKLIDSLNVEAELSQKGARWNPNVGSVTSQAIMGQPSQIGDELVRAGANIMSGNKVGLIGQLVSIARRQGYSERQLNEIGDLLLSSPDDALKRLFPGYKPAPPGPTTGLGGPAAPASQPATALGSTPEPVAARTTQPERNAAPATALGSIGGGTAGYNAPLDLNGDGEISEEERIASGAIGTALGGVGGKVLGDATSRMGRNVAPGVSQQTFGGINAKTADKAKLARAQEMDAAGADRRAIWDATGWFKGADGKWRFEIDDRGVRAKDTAVARQEGRLGDFVTDAGARGAYRDLGGIETFRGTVPDQAGYSPAIQDGTGEMISFGGRGKTARDQLLHERQHAIQRREGFAVGTSPTREADANRLMSPDDAMDAYSRSAGEVEARNVQTRRDFTPEQRRAQAPWETQDVPDDQQIVRFGSGGPQMSMGNGLTRPPAPANDRRLVDRMFSPKPGAATNSLPTAQGAPRAANDMENVPLGPSRAPDMFNDLTLEERTMLERKLGKPQPRKATAGPDGTIAPPDPVIGEYQTPNGAVRLTAKTWVDERGELVMSPDWPTNAFSDLAGALDQRGKEIRRPNQDFGRLRTDSVWAQQNPDVARQMSQDVAQRFVNQARSGGRPVSILAQLDEFDNEALVRMVQDAAPSTHVVLRRKDGDGIALVEKEWLRQNRDARFPDATWSRFGVGRQYVRYSDR